MKNQYAVPKITFGTPGQYTSIKPEKSLFSGTPENPIPTPSFCWKKTSPLKGGVKIGKWKNERV